MRFYKPVSGGAILPSLSNPASSSDIVSGAEAINGAGEKLTGSHICAGVEELTADATATADNITSGKTAYVKGSKVTGSHVCTTLTQMTLDADATATDIMSGKTAYVKGSKVTGNHVCKTVGELTADANATAADIMSGKTAYINGEKITGEAVAGAEYEVIKLTSNSSSFVYSLDNVTSIRAGGTQYSGNINSIVDLTGYIFTTQQSVKSASLSISEKAVSGGSEKFAKGLSIMIIADPNGEVIAP